MRLRSRLETIKINGSIDVFNAEHAAVGNISSAEKTYVAYVRALRDAGYIQPLALEIADVIIDCN